MSVRRLPRLQSLALFLIHCSVVCGGVIAPPGATPPDDGQWSMPAKNFASTRYSELTEINTENVGQLQVAFTFSIGVNKGQEAAPLVVNNTMYIVSPYPNILYALDLTKPARPSNGNTNRNLRRLRKALPAATWSIGARSIADGQIFYNTLDGNTVAVDAETGKEIWKTKLGNIHIGETITMAPLVVKGKVLVGNSGGEMGVRGWIAALDAKDGKIVWKAYNTGPDADVLIGPDFKPFYAKDRGKDLGRRAGPRKRGRSAAAMSGGGSPTIPTST